MRSFREHDIAPLNADDLAYHRSEIEKEEEGYQRWIKAASKLLSRKRHGL